MNPRTFYFSVAFVVAFCSLVYELLIAKMVSDLTGNALVWESLTIGIYLASLGLGSWLYEAHWARGQRINLARVEFWLSLLGLALPVLILGLHMVYRIYLFDSGLMRSEAVLPPVFWFGLSCQVLTIAIGVLSGIELPALIHLIDDGAEDTSTGSVLAVMYSGNLVASLLFAYGLMQLNPVIAVMVAAVSNFIVCIGLVVATQSKKMALLATLVFSGFCITTSLAEDTLSQLHLKNFYYNKFEFAHSLDDGYEEFQPVGIKSVAGFVDRFPEIEVYRSSYHSIHFVEHIASKLDEDAAGPGGYSIFMNGRFQVGTQSVVDYHEHLVHLPIMLTKKHPQTVLILGGGDGAAAFEALKYPAARVTVVDLDRTLTDLAKHHPKLTQLNRNALADPRVDLINRDAFVYLRGIEDRSVPYMIVDFTYPFDFDSARLFSVEFFALALKKLQPDGQLVISSPVDFRSTANFPEFDFARDVAFNTLTAAGAKHILAYEGGYDSALLVRQHDEDFAPEFFDLGIEMREFGPEFFTEKNWEVLVGKRDSSLANSMLKPLFFGLEDSFY